jgi:hypothetical protein
LAVSLDILHRPKGENRTAHGLQPWVDVPERIALKGRPNGGHYSQRKRSPIGLFQEAIIETHSVALTGQFSFSCQTQGLKAWAIDL